MSSSFSSIFNHEAHEGLQSVEMLLSHRFHRFSQEGIYKNANSPMASATEKVLFFK